MDWDSSSKFGMHIDFHHFERMQSLNLISEVDFRLYDRHLEKSIWRQMSADVCPITTKFRRRMQHDMLIITHTLYVKKEIGSKIPKWRPSIIRNRICFISAVDWGISSKFSMQIDFSILKRVYLIEIAWNMYKNCKYKCKKTFCFMTTCKAHR